MFKCNRCGSKSNVITIPTEHMKCPICEEGELVLDCCYRTKVDVLAESPDKRGRMERQSFIIYLN
jgi:hypothetical protein